MKTLIILTTMVLLTLFVIMSCEKEKNDSINEQLLLPLSVGNIWDYGNFKLKITDKYTINYMNENIEVFSLGRIIDEDSVFLNHKNLFSYDAMGNIYCNGATITSDTLHMKSLYLNNNCNENEFWDYYQVVATGQSTQVTDVEINDTVDMICFTIDSIISIPLGQFKCNGFVYSFSDDDDIRSYECYYSKGVGLVKQIVKINGVAFQTSTLQSYLLNE